MWLGVAVASILGLALLAALGTAVNFAFHRRFGIAAAIALPTCLVGYFFLSLAGPAAWKEIVGDPNLESVAEGAVQVPGDELQALYEDRTHVGLYYDNGDWNHYRETYLPGGTIRGKSGPESNPDQWTYSGQWKIEDGRICQKYDGEFSCSDVYVSGTTYQYANDPGDDVTSRFVVAAPLVELDPAAEQLTGDALYRVIEGMTLTGRLTDATKGANFTATFYANNHAIYTLRGNDPDRLDEEEYGWYRFAGDRVCLSNTLGTNHDCFSVYQTENGLSFVLTGNEVILMAEPQL